MNPHFDYQDGILHCEAVSLAGIARLMGGVAYVYSAAAMRENHARFQAAVAPLGGRVFYAMKANDTPQIIQLLNGLGTGIDAVRLEEVMLAVACGVDPQDIVFSGLEKDEAALDYALSVGVGQINVESEDELRRIARLARESGRQARIAFRVKPDIGAGGHGKITTGLDENKFGVSIEDTMRLYAEAARMDGIRLHGLSMHIGSQITDGGAFREAFSRLAALTRELRRAGLEVPALDLGGGIGIDYTGDTQTLALEDYAATVRETVGDLGCALAFEPGRYLVGDAGVLITPTVVVKEQAGQPPRPITKSNMAHLVRTAMYGSCHRMVPLVESDALQDTRPAGGICESSDEWEAQRLPVPDKDADGIFQTMWLAHLDAGAYGASMESHVNMTPYAGAVLVDGDKAQVLRECQTPEQMVQEKLKQYSLKTVLNSA